MYYFHKAPKRTYDETGIFCCQRHAREYTKNQERLRRLQEAEERVRLQEENDRDRAVLEQAEFLEAGIDQGPPDAQVDHALDQLENEINNGFNNPVVIEDTDIVSI